jgi:hypothetical protein
MNELQAGVELALAIVSKPPAFLQPRKGALNPQRLGMTANRCRSWRRAICTEAPNSSPTARRKGCPAYIGIGQNGFYIPEAFWVLCEGHQRTATICHLRRCQRAMACGKPCVSTAIGRACSPRPSCPPHSLCGAPSPCFLEALRINDAKAPLGFAPLCDTGRAHT